MIKLDHVTKVYKQTISVNKLNLQIKAGEFFGLLGPNGAGKTTVIRMLTALTMPTEGSIIVNGCLVHRNDVRFKAEVGLVPQHINLEPELTVIENLRLHAMLYNIPPAQTRKKIEELLAFADLEEKAGAIVNTLSGGMKRKVLIARALMHNPKILLLDEPTVGLDVFIRRKVWDLIKSLNARGITILLTTHYLEEAESLCNRIGLLKKGRLIMDGSPEELRQLVGPVVVEQFRDEQTTLHFFGSRQEALSFAASLRYEFTIRQAKLEDVFVKLTEERVGA
ncbi:ABC transporter ATP-binding protein [Pelotomaculum propionicicum]|uniref:Daunorubicin/doxorubicin resistance ATP-binding protein DrrA n=1 Tax=Pelotomaculum propionicicum TaxID=258475 RepID=A0A4Y7RT83_9FIRM|nr:ABC transporter ATP-binding protein [Pelotomaculum propionicicum]NLI12549.1 ABC transporter ATP-binding protein [Peptococcaceae bacterium]TEB11939.1 Daunorubicin/doxorubicin resistance ATP-binding protein DrrA [Pelotomaculum propionicicum]